MASESHKTVYLALAANAGIGVAKLAGAACSAARRRCWPRAPTRSPTRTNQLFLLASLTFAEREPDERAPVRLRQGALLLVVHGGHLHLRLRRAVLDLRGRRTSCSNGEAASGRLGSRYVVLGSGVRARGLLAAARAAPDATARPSAPTRPSRATCATSRDPTTKTVVFEDSRGGASAWSWPPSASGCTSSPATRRLRRRRVDPHRRAAGGRRRSCSWRDTRGLLIGEAALPEEREALRARARRHHERRRGRRAADDGARPGLAARRRRASTSPTGSTRDDVEELASELERALREAVPAVRLRVPRPDAA